MSLIKLLPLGKDQCNCDEGRPPDVPNNPVHPNILGSKMLSRLMKDGTTFFAVLFCKCYHRSRSIHLLIAPFLVCSVANVITLNYAAPALKIMMFT